MPLPTPGEMRDRSKTNAQVREMMAQLAENVQDKSKSIFSYSSLEAANADISNIPVGVIVKIDSSVDGGEYKKNTLNATRACPHLKNWF